MNNDEFGKRMKRFESYETQRTFLPGLPIYARLDGRGFSVFTKGMEKPYDERLSKLMSATTKHLVEKTHAKFGYSQSDEISLIFNNDDILGDIFFARKIFKLTSVLASMATAYFMLNIRNYFDEESANYESRLPHFDARVIQFPSKIEASNMVLWRTIDANRNAISMAAQSKFSHKSLKGVSSLQMKEKLLKFAGINFDEYPMHFKQGVFFHRVLKEKTLSPEVLALIPEHERAEAALKTYTRSKVEEIQMPMFHTVSNKDGVIFNAEPPTLFN
jgi:tRNA(His) 5'-end guanylyltransferase